MIFWIFVITMLIGIGLLIWNDCGEYSEVRDIAGCFMSIISAILILIFICIIIFGHVGVDGYIAEMDARRQSLVYQLENNVYENDNDIGKRALMEDIQDYNETIARAQANQDDFWIGIFYADIYDRFELIDLEVEE